MSFIPRALLTSGLLAALTIGAAACGSSGGSTSSAASSAPAAPAASTASSAASSSGSQAAPAVKLSANDATAEELQTIPGVGPEIAKEILEYRPYDPQTGPDKFRDELAKYIDDAEIERIMTYLDFGA